MTQYQMELYHYGIKGQKHGIRRFQNEDGSLTVAGRRRYLDDMKKKAGSMQDEEKEKQSSKTIDEHSSLSGSGKGKGQSGVGNLADEGKSKYQQVSQKAKGMIDSARAEAQARIQSIGRQVGSSKSGPSSSDAASIIDQKMQRRAEWEERQRERQQVSGQQNAGSGSSSSRSVNASTPASSVSSTGKPAAVSENGNTQTGQIIKPGRVRAGKTKVNAVLEAK